MRKFPVYFCRFFFSVRKTLKGNLPDNAIISRMLHKHTITSLRRR